MTDSEIDGATYKLLLELTHEMHNCMSLRQLEYFVTENIHRVIACDLVTLNKIDLAGNMGGSIGLFSPEFISPSEIEPHFDRWVHQHALVQEFLRTGDGTPRRMSDFVDMDEFQKTELYKFVFKPLRSLHQIAFSVVSVPGMVVGIGINRTTQNFSDAELEMSKLVWESLPAAFRHVQLREIHERELQLQAVPDLSEREREILVYMRAGMGNQAIAESLHLAKRTVEKHLENLYAKLGVSSRTAAINVVWPPLFKEG